MGAESQNISRKYISSLNYQLPVPQKSAPESPSAILPITIAPSLTLSPLEHETKSNESILDGHSSPKVITSTSATSSPDFTSVKGSRNIINQYILGDTLGQGMYGKVKLAEDKETGTKHVTF
jgi:hypothetical protein